MKRILAAAAALALTLMLCSCSSSPAALTIDGATVSAARFGYYCVVMKANLVDTYGSDVNLDALVPSDDGEEIAMADVIKEAAYKQILREFAMLRLARDNGISLEKADEPNVQQYIDDTIASIGDKYAYDKFLTQYGLSESEYKSILRDYLLMTKAQSILFAEGGAYYPTADEIAEAGDAESALTKKYDRVISDVVERLSVVKSDAYYSYIVT